MTCRTSTRLRFRRCLQLRSVGGGTQLPHLAARVGTVAIVQRVGGIVSRERSEGSSCRVGRMEMRIALAARYSGPLCVVDVLLRGTFATRCSPVNNERSILAGTPGLLFIQSATAPRIDDFALD